MNTIKKENLIHIPTLDCDDFYMRALVYEDYKDYYEYGHDPRVTKALSWELSSLEEAKTAIKIVHLSRPNKGIPIPYAIIDKKSGKMIGTCDFHTIDWEQSMGEIGYVLHHDYWSKGIMTKACMALLYFGFQYLLLDTVSISHALDNKASQRVIEKCGFHYQKDIIAPSLNKKCRHYTMTKRAYLKKVKDKQENQ